MKTKCILVVEDDKPIQKHLSAVLKEEGFDILSTAKGQEAIHLAASNNPDMVLLDLGLPDLDGMEVIKRIREWSQVPILIISARERESDKIEALDLGADDYIIKPFSTNELLARIRAIYRRFVKDEGGRASFVFDGLEIDYAKHEVKLNGENISMTAIEFKILHLLAQNAGKVLTHNFIINKVWGAGNSDSRTLRVFIAGIRRKIEKESFRPYYIATDIGVGYKMNI